MNQQEELEAVRASESIKQANLQELARLVLIYEAVDNNECTDAEYEKAYSDMIDFAKGVAQ